MGSKHLSKSLVGLNKSVVSLEQDQNNKKASLIIKEMIEKEYSTPVFFQKNISYNECQKKELK